MAAHITDAVPARDVDPRRHTHMWIDGGDGLPSVHSPTGRSIVTPACWARLVEVAAATTVQIEHRTTEGAEATDLPAQHPVAIHVVTPDDITSHMPTDCDEPSTSLLVLPADYLVRVRVRSQVTA